MERLSNREISQNRKGKNNLVRAPLAQYVLRLKANVHTFTLCDCGFKSRRISIGLARGSSWSLCLILEKYLDGSSGLDQVELLRSEGKSADGQPLLLSPKLPTGPAENGGRST